jgi:hypothetical protein
MGNHYHLLLETPEPNLSRGMRQLNGVYTQAFNRRHDRVGHVFQGRYQSILVEKGVHLLELCRYIVLNPVAAGLVESPEQWPWSSYRQTATGVRCVDFLSTGWILGQLSGDDGKAREQYVQFVGDRHTRQPWQRLQGQIFLGSPDFVAGFANVIANKKGGAEIPRRQRYPSRPQLDELLSGFEGRTERNSRIAQAHTHGYTLKEIADNLKIHYTTVSKIVNKDGKES